MPMTRVAPIIGVNFDGSLEIFDWMGASSLFRHKRQTAANSANWSNWQSRGTGVASAPSLGRDSGHVLHVFALNANGKLIVRKQTALAAATYTDWQVIDGEHLAGRPVVEQKLDECFEVFAVGTDGKLHHVWQTAPNSNAWSNWVAFPNVPSTSSPRGEPTAFHDDDGAMQICYVAEEAAGQRLVVLHRWQLNALDSGRYHGDPAAAGWSEGHWIGYDYYDYHIVNHYDTTFRPAGRVTWVANRDGRVEFFARGADGALWHAWEKQRDGKLDPTAAGWRVYWNTWISLGGQMLGDPAPIANRDGRIEIFVHGTDGSLQHIWQQHAGGPDWSSWASLGGAPLAADPAAGRHANGTIEVFTWQGSYSPVFRRVRQTAANNGWGSWITDNT
jgi:hypothetical protein